MTALKENIDLSASSIHNHLLLQTTEESNTNAKLRCMTDDQKACAELLFRCGNPPERIHLTLSRDCHRSGLPVEFTAKDISNMFGPSVLEKSLVHWKISQTRRSGLTRWALKPNSGLLAIRGTQKPTVFILRPGLKLFILLW
jgi:hypothetical protein